MGKPAARFSDLHACPALLGATAPIVTGCWTVFTGKLPQARVSDLCACSGGFDPIALGSFTVFVGGFSAARVGDLTSRGGVISPPCLPTVLIG